MLVFLRRLADEEGIEDTKLDGKHRKALELRRRECGQRGGYINTWAAAFRRATQYILQFIRWFRHQLIRKISFGQGVTQLRPLMESYL